MGGGHAGLEAAWLSSQFDLTVAIVTLPGVGLGSAPCNPAVGGVGKGQVVREIDALGGLMGKLADKAGIQFRVLNESKGYGFITENDSGTEYFVHISGLIDEIKQGDAVEFELTEGKKGMNAVNVKVI